VATEREWVEVVKSKLAARLSVPGIEVITGHRLPYAYHIASYTTDGSRLSEGTPVSETHGYQTDLMLIQRTEGGEEWVPRVVVEFKLGSVTTHDALTYSAKAATHKNVHPYLRYGIVIGGYSGPVPKRVIRHGQNFDFMVTVGSEALTSRDADRLVNLLKSEVSASETLSSLMSSRSNIHMLHKRLEVAAYEEPSS
jgi:hypothetical protein